METEIELENCPFCGKEANTDGGLAWCSDIECFAYDINMPIGEWNTRPIEDMLRKELQNALDLIAESVDK